MENRIAYTVIAEIGAIEERFNREWISGRGAEAIFKETSRGWFVHFIGSNEAIRFGDEKPDWNVGDKVKITFERVQ